MVGHNFRHFRTHLVTDSSLFSGSFVNLFREFDHSSLVEWKTPDVKVLSFKNQPEGAFEDNDGSLDITYCVKGLSYMDHSLSEARKVQIVNCSKE